MAIATAQDRATSEAVSIACASKVSFGVAACSFGYRRCFFQAEDGIRDLTVTGVQTCALPIYVREAVARDPLAAAFLISLLIHALLFGGWRMGKSLGWWDHQATWLLNITKKLQSARVMARFTPPPPPQQMREIPLMFMEVDPTLAVVEPPKDAKFYGAQNSQARNPDERDKADPKVDGKQTKIVRAEDVPKPKPFPLQPALDTPTPKPPEEASKPKSEPAGDLA